MKESLLINSVKKGYQKTISPFKQFKQFKIITITKDTKFISYKDGYTLYKDLIVDAVNNKWYFIILIFK